MLLRILSSNKPGNAVFLFFLTLFLWLPALFGRFHDASAVSSEEMPLYLWLVSLLGNNLVLKSVISLLLLLMQSWLLVLFSTRFMLLQTRSFLPAAFYLLITSFYPALLGFSPALLAGFFLIISLNLLFQSYESEGVSYQFFNSALVLGLGMLFYPKLIIILPVYWIAASVLRKPQWREFLMPVAGIALPFLVFAGIDFLLGNNAFGIIDIYRDSLIDKSISFQAETGHWIIIGILILNILISSIYMLEVFQFRKIYIRNYYLVFFWLFLFGLIAMILLFGRDPGIIYLLAIPLSFIFSNYFLNARRSRGNTLLLWLFLVAFLFNTLNAWIRI